MRTYIGIDGGGSQTQAVVLSETLDVLGRGLAGASNHYAVGAEQAAAKVSSREASRDGRDSMGTRMGRLGKEGARRGRVAHRRLAVYGKSGRSPHSQPRVNSRSCCGSGRSADSPRMSWATTRLLSSILACRRGSSRIAPIG